MKLRHRLAALAVTTVAAATMIGGVLPSTAFAFPSCDLSEKVKELQAWDHNGKYNILVWKDTADGGKDLRGIEHQGSEWFHECKFLGKSSTYHWAVFKEGWFLHKGDGGYRNWAYYGLVTREGEKVNFFPR
ncbi:hypothetical protein JOF53_007344 [Crossiella equi]|uniref:Uncharacterized protein n=1 Tax=Crossiella equi TaxID=130796 RepID=A0ABS5AQF0_9PSEU|nr:hypothetical protein [Crossiella equi]MBP2478472.1 hypothetical protein [Crossiella equi]